MNIILPFLSVVLGALAALIIKPKNNASIKMLLTFSGAFLLSAAATEFLPEIYETGDHTAGLYLMLGVFIQIILEFFSKGAEHGHLHMQNKATTFPILLFISLCIHSFLEGMPLQEMNSMLYGVAVHKLPIAFIFTAFLLSSSLKPLKVILVILCFAMMSPLGTLLTDSTTWLQDYMLPIKAVVAGIVLHVSTTLILESSEGHKYNTAKILIMIAGAVLGFVI